MLREPVPDDILAAELEQVFGRGVGVQDAEIEAEIDHRSRECIQLRRERWVAHAEDERALTALRLCARLVCSRRTRKQLKEVSNAGRRLLHKQGRLWRFGCGATLLLEIGQSWRDRSDVFFVQRDRFLIRLETLQHR